MPVWRNWQTRWTQNPVPSREYRFDSDHRHYGCFRYHFKKTERWFISVLSFLFTCESGCKKINWYRIDTEMGSGINWQNRAISLDTIRIQTYFFYFKKIENKLLSSGIMIIPWACYLLRHRNQSPFTYAQNAGMHLSCERTNDVRRRKWDSNLHFCSQQRFVSGLHSKQTERKWSWISLIVNQRNISIYEPAISDQIVTE